MRRDGQSVSPVACLSLQFHHLPMSFHWKQEELKFNTVLRRVQHRVGETRLLREALQPGAEAGQGGVPGGVRGPPPLGSQP